MLTLYHVYHCYYSTFLLYHIICISQIWVYGNSFESYLVAVVNPNEQSLKRWAENNGIDAQDFPALCSNPKAKEYILGELTKFAKEKKVIVIYLTFFFCQCVKFVID